MVDVYADLARARDWLTSQANTPWLTVLLVDLLIEHQKALDSLRASVDILDISTEELAAELSRHSDRVSEFTYRLSEHLAGER